MKKHIYFICYAIILSFYSFSDPIPNNWIGSDIESKNDIARRIITGDVSYLKYDIDFLSLGTLEKRDLRILLNSIYAYHGYIFKEKDLTDTFSKFPWYISKNENVDKMLSSTDRLNINVISTYMNINEEMKPAIENNYLIGIWMQSPLWFIPSGFPRRFFFYSDGSVIFKYSQYRWFKIADSFSGRYKISGNCLIITINEKTFNMIPKQENAYEYTDVKRVNTKCNEVIKLPVIKKEKFLNPYYDQSAELSGNNWKDCDCIEIGGSLFYRWFNNTNWSGDK
jgi:hypothetical protein